MTVTSPAARAVHVTHEAVADYSFPFKVFKAGELAVDLVNASFRIIPLALGLDYIVDGLGLDQGGNITLTAAGQDKAGTGLSLVLLRRMDFTQETDYRPYDAFPAETHERALDILTMICQELREQVGRALIAPPNMEEPVQYSDLAALLEGAEAARDGAGSEAGRAEAAQAGARLAKSQARAAAALARKWASNPEGVPVLYGLFSARHYALKAAEAAEVPPPAANDALGLVRGEAGTPGKVSVEPDGTMTVNGFGEAGGFSLFDLKPNLKGVIDPGFLSVCLDNGLLPGAAFPEALALVKTLQAAGGNVVTFAQYNAQMAAQGGVCARFALSDDETMFRIPCAPEIYWAGAMAGQNVGDFLVDQMRPITGGPIESHYNVGGGGIYGSGTQTRAVGGTGNWVMARNYLDSSRLGLHFSGSRTRPQSVVCDWQMKMKNGA